MKKFNYISILLFILSAVFLYPKMSVRVKDISYIEGIRKNQLKGYGLVVGLNGEGDSANNPLTLATLKNFFENIGISVTEAGLKTKNLAVVMVTADVGGFISEGDRLSVNVASIGDAKSLEGGVLLQTPLKGGDGETYLVAQGSVIVAAGNNVSKTSGSVPAGGFVEKAIMSDYIGSNNTVRFVLNEADFKTMFNMREAMKNAFTDIALKSVDAKKLEVTIPSEFTNNIIEFISRAEEIELELDTSAKVVINEREGIIVMGEDVRISSVGVSVSGLKINVGKQSAFGEEEDVEPNQVFDDATDVKSLVDSLNDLGVDIKDTIHVLIALKKAGALNAEIIVE